MLNNIGVSVSQYNCDKILLVASFFWWFTQIKDINIHFDTWEYLNVPDLLLVEPSG